MASVEECPSGKSPWGKSPGCGHFAFRTSQWKRKITAAARALDERELLSIDTSIKIKNHASDSLKEFAWVQPAAGRPLEGRRRKRIKCDRKSDDWTSARPRFDGDSHGNGSARGTRQRAVVVGVSDGGGRFLITTGNPPANYTLPPFAKAQFGAIILGDVHQRLNTSSTGILITQAACWNRQNMVIRNIFMF